MRFSGEPNAMRRSRRPSNWPLTSTGSACSCSTVSAWRKLQLRPKRPRRATARRGWRCGRAAPERNFNQAPPTPLNARVVGELKGDGFRVEKIIFQSLPDCHVTALLYLPTDARPPFPAVLVPCGHTANGKASSGYQRVCMLLARSGMAAFCYDPIGQGERYQLLDDAGRPRYKSTTEHTLVGVSSMLVGRNTATYRVWDGVRALDYLQQRDDIDGARLGCTGNSGGGTLTEYLMALDRRILCAAPGCSVTTFRKRLEDNGLGDAEQNIYGQIAFGLGHADYFHLRAPRPALICSATRDYVDIDGAWQIFSGSQADLHPAGPFRGDRPDRGRSEAWFLTAAAHRRRPLDASLVAATG